MRPRQEIRVRRYQPGDRDRVMPLRPRLTEGTAAWRDPCVTLETGAASQPERSPYWALGYEEEDIGLTKHPLSREGP
jgi:hypothetical protein